MGSENTGELLDELMPKGDGDREPSDVIVDISPTDPEPGILGPDSDLFGGVHDATQAHMADEDPYADTGGDYA